MTSDSEVAEAAKEEPKRQHKDFTLGKLRYQSLLMQLLHPKVRADFLDGRICDISRIDALVDTEEVLMGIDWLRQIVLPKWRAPQVSMGILAREADSCMTLLLQAADTFHDHHESQGVHWTFKRWAEMLELIGTSLYWSEIPSAIISVEHLTVPPNILQDPVKERSPATSKSLSRHSASPSQERIKEEQCEVEQRPKFIERYYPKRDKRVRKRAKEIELICLSDSSSQSPDSEISFAIGHHSSARRTPEHYSLRTQREVVKPLPFVPNGWQSLREYLSNYERYFSIKFEGNSRDCTQELAHFLPPELRACYDAVGGHRLPYEEMKRELLTWYRSHKISGTRHWRDQLRVASMKSEESLKLYGLRLRELAQKAFPTDNVECVRELRHHFLTTVPSEFARQIEYTEGSSLVSGSGKRLSWAAIMRLAEREDERVRRRPHAGVGESSTAQDMWFSRDDTRQVYQTQFAQQSETPYAQPGYGQQQFAPAFADVAQEQRATSSRDSPRSPRTFTSRRGQLQRQQPSRARPTSAAICLWCGKVGHTVEDCWEKQGVCLGCGNPNHSWDGCQNNRRRQPPGFQPICPICKGPHLGRDCPRPLN